MTDLGQSNDLALLAELERELARLSSDRAVAETKRDQILMVVEAGDDSGFSLSMALRELKQIENRMEQVQNLLAGIATRPKGRSV
jgi:predicted phosphoribosyltransferase